MTKTLVNFTKVNMFSLVTGNGFYDQNTDQLDKKSVFSLVKGDGFYEQNTDQFHKI